MRQVFQTGMTGHRRLALAAFLTFLLTTNVDAADRQPRVPELNVEKYTLPNGLEVLMLEDHTTPVVAVNIWYKVGSKDEKPGRTGIRPPVRAHDGRRVGAPRQVSSLARSKSSVPTGATPLPTSTARITSRRSLPTAWNWRSGSNPIGWDSFCRP